MNIYLAGVSSGIRAYSNDIDIYKGANMLESYYYANNFTEEVIIPNAKRFLLDSGAFTFIQNQKNEINWEEYIVKYANFINKNKVELFFELDIDDIVGYEKVKEYRKLLENLTQKKSIPVWHNSRGKDEWKKCVKNMIMLPLVDLWEMVEQGQSTQKKIKNTFNGS